MTLYRLLELHCDGDDGDDGDCPAQPDMTRAMQSYAELWAQAKDHGWVRRRVDGRFRHFCKDCAAQRPVSDRALSS